MTNKQKRLAIKFDKQDKTYSEIAKLIGATELDVFKFLNGDKR